MVKVATFMLYDFTTIKKKSGEKSLERLGRYDPHEEDSRRECLLSAHHTQGFSPSHLSAPHATCSRRSTGASRQAPGPALVASSLTRGPQGSARRVALSVHTPRSTQLASGPLSPVQGDQGSPEATLPRSHVQRSGDLEPDRLAQVCCVTTKL